MKKKFALRMIYMLFLLLILSGCLNTEQRKEKKNIEKEVKQIMLDYLKDNYNINNVDNVNAEYTLVGDIATSTFKGTVTGRFIKDGQSYQILYDYNNNKCYDSFSYIKKVNPILTNYFKDILDNYLTKDIIKPDYVVIHDKFYGLYTYIEDNSYGFFNNYDTVNNFEDIANYYNISLMKIIYNNSNKIIENNISAFEKLYKDVNFFIEVNVYNQGVINEYFFGNPEGDFGYYINDIINIGDFTAYWHIKEKTINKYKSIEQGSFELSLIDNNNYFDKIIELYGNKYKLYSEKILIVRDISNNDDLHYLYLELNKDVCNSHSVIVHKENSDIDEFSHSVSFFSGMYETKKFAIYCKK